MTKPSRISVPVIVLSIILALSIALNLIQFFNRHTPDMKSNFSILEFYSINHREII